MGDPDTFHSSPLALFAVTFSLHQLQDHLMLLRELRLLVNVIVDLWLVLGREWSLTKKLLRRCPSAVTVQPRASWLSGIGVPRSLRCKPIVGSHRLMIQPVVGDSFISHIKVAANSFSWTAQLISSAMILLRKSCGRNAHATTMRPLRSTSFSRARSPVDRCKAGHNYAT